MIILKHITIERFRLLREVNLHFPQRGSILIQGQNEAGKSALVESIYFALYGEPLASPSTTTRLDDLILYGASTASVTLTLSVGSTELTVKRTLERVESSGRLKGSRDAIQSVHLLVQKPGMAGEEPITSLSAANRRIIKELGGLDGEGLRNSCLIEQKGLGRLEQLPGRERENTLRKLLGLESLLHLSEQFTITPDDELLLQQHRDRFTLAQVQARIPELSERLATCESALDVVSLQDELSEISQQEEEESEQRLTFEHIRATRGKLKARQHRAGQLRKAEDSLGEIIAAYDDMARVERELPELDRQIADLDRREREELPVLEQRTMELADLTRSFGTLERMSNDLLSSIQQVKDLEQEAREYDTLQSSIDALEEEVAAARFQLEQLRQQMSELEERRRAGRPVLEERLNRLQNIAERLALLRQAESRLSSQATGREQSAENNRRLAQLQQDMQAAEKEQALLTAEIQQREAQITEKTRQREALEVQQQKQQRARSLLEEWLRLKGISREQASVEQRVMAVHSQQEQLTLAAFDANRRITIWFAILFVCVVVFLLGFTGATIEALQQAPFLILFSSFFAFTAGAGIFWSWQKYDDVRGEKFLIEEQVKQTIKQVGRLVAERETVMRRGVDSDALNKIEQELQALGSKVPGSYEEATASLQQLSRERSDSLAGAGERERLSAGSGTSSGGITGNEIIDLQTQIAGQSEALAEVRRRESLLTARISSLQEERALLEEQRKQQRWDDIEGSLQAEQDALLQKRHELLALLGQEGLPIPSRYLASEPADSRSATSADEAELERVIRDSIIATEQEIALLDDRQQWGSALAARIQAAQEKLDSLLASKQALEERRTRLQDEEPAQQIARAREQQAALRSALQNLQDSLRERVKPLGIAFGQTTISNVEAAIRKQLEALHLALGNKIELQSRRIHASSLLKERQEALPEYYQQLAKFSNSLGSWIVPLNPFAEALAALRTRCQQELQEVNESAIQSEFEKLKLQESAAKAKIELCQHEIEQVQRRITALLVQHNRPLPASFTRAELVVVWPLIDQYNSEDRNHLEAERAILARELQQVEQQELHLSQQLQTGGERLDLQQAELRLRQQERSYQTRKYGSRLIQAVDERLMRKMLPLTEYYMQQILPLLTAGRYHNVKLFTEPEEGAIGGGPIQLRVWETAAGEYIPKMALSGGAADQLSLALRLAFAIASLPSELVAAPGFLLLDEPLSSFDHGRARSLVDVVTGDLLGQHFEQILFISHSSAFDQAMFPYHLYMDNGIIVDSNFPVVQSSTVSVPPSNGHIPDVDDDDPNEETVKIAVPTFTREQ